MMKLWNLFPLVAVCSGVHCGTPSLSLKNGVHGEVPLGWRKEPPTQHSARGMPVSDNVDIMKSNEAGEDPAVSLVSLATHETVFSSGALTLLVFGLGFLGVMLFAVKTNVNVSKGLLWDYRGLALVLGVTGIAVSVMWYNKLGFWSEPFRTVDNLCEDFKLLGCEDDVRKAFDELVALVPMEAGGYILPREAIALNSEKKKVEEILQKFTKEKIDKRRQMAGAKADKSNPKLERGLSEIAGRFGAEFLALENVRELLSLDLKEKTMKEFSFEGVPDFLKSAVKDMVKLRMYTSGKTENDATLGEVLEKLIGDRLDAFVDMTADKHVGFVPDYIKTKMALFGEGAKLRHRMLTLKNADLPTEMWDAIECLYATIVVDTAIRSITEWGTPEV